MIEAFAAELAPAGVVGARFGPDDAEITGHGIEAGARFEIGSVTKVFNTRLLTRLAADGVVGLGEPARELLGPDWRLGDHATLERLARHRAGLPRTPRRLWAGGLRHRSDPWATLTVEDLRRSLPVPPRPRWFRYSNFGAALLGHALAARAGRPWAELVAEHVPLPATGVGGPVAQPHRRGHPVPPWTLDSVQAAGALRSTAADLVAFVRDEREWLGWMPGGDVRWHNGGTGGSSSFVAWDRGRRSGVVLLANAACAQRLTALGQRLLR